MFMSLATSVKQRMRIKFLDLYNLYTALTCLLLCLLLPILILVCWFCMGYINFVYENTDFELIFFLNFALCSRTFCFM